MLSSILLFVFSVIIGSHAHNVVTVVENDTLLLPCQIEDGGDTRVEWWFHNVLLGISGDTNKTIPGVKIWANLSLELTQVKPKDTGFYKCITESTENVVYQIYQVVIKYPPKIEVTPDSGVLDVKLNETAVMVCSASGQPEPEISWYYQGELLPVLAPHGKLRIDVDSRIRAGTYTCVANNQVGEPARADIELKVKHKPEVSAEKQWVHTAPGMRIGISCIVIAYPESEIGWYLDGKLISFPSPFQFVHDWPKGGPNAIINHLVIRNVRDADLGTYTCRAKNDLGTDEVEIELSGLSNTPVLKKELKPSSKHSYNFIWEVDSYSPVIEYQFWFRQVGNLSHWRRLYIPERGYETTGPLHARSFNLTGLDSSREYEALVIARNRFGWSKPSKIVKFTTLGIPKAEEEVYKTNTNNLEKIDLAEQVTSDSHRSTMDTNSSSCFYGDFLTLLTFLLFSIGST